MSFDALETSIEASGRVELYVLATGSTIFRMHDSVEGIINYSGDDFERVQVSRGTIATGQEHLTISLPGDHVFSRQFTFIGPGQTSTLTIFSYHRDDPADVRVIYKGIVRAVAFTHDMAKSQLAVVPISVGFDKVIPQRTFQAACNNVLFDADCKVVSGSYEHTGAATAVDMNVVTIQGLLAAKGDDWATAGFASYGSLDYRLILVQNGDDITLTLPFYADVVGTTLNVFAGCGRTIGICNSKF